MLVHELAYTPAKSLIGAFSKIGLILLISFWYWIYLAILSFIVRPRFVDDLAMILVPEKSGVYPVLQQKAAIEDLSTSLLLIDPSCSESLIDSGLMVWPV